jgi:hypothetical protein
VDVLDYVDLSLIYFPVSGMSFSLAGGSDPGQAHSMRRARSASLSSDFTDDIFRQFKYELVPDIQLPFFRHA